MSRITRSANRNWLVLVAGATTALVAAGCSGTEPRAAEPDEIRAVLAAHETLKAQGAARLDARFELRRGRRIVQSSDIAGRVDFASERVHLELEHPGYHYFREGRRGNPLRFELIAEGSDWYLRVPDNPAAFGLGWAAIDASGLPAAVQPFPHPDAFLTGLRDLTGIEVVGREGIEGVRTTHYRGATPFPSLSELLAADEALRCEVWLDDDGLVHRLRYEFTLSEDRSSLSVILDFRDHGNAPPIEIPDDITWNLTVANIDQLENLYRQMGLGGIGTED